MGASCSLILPLRVTPEDFKSWSGNIYSGYFYNKLKGIDGCIDRGDLSKFALSIADVYM